MALYLSAATYAQNDPVGKIFDKYSGIEGYTTVHVTGDLLKMVAKMDTGDQDLNAVTNMLDEIKILAQEDASAAKLDFYNEVYMKLDRSLFKELLTVKEATQKVNMLAKEDNGIISEFILIVSGEDNVLISIKGRIQLDKMGDLAESFDFAGFEKLKLLEEEHN